MASLTDGIAQAIIARLAQPPNVIAAEVRGGGRGGSAGSAAGKMLGNLVSQHAANKKFEEETGKYEDAKAQLSGMVGKELTDQEARAAGLVKPIQPGATSIDALRFRAAEQDVQMGDLEIESAIRARDNEILDKRSTLELGEFMSQAIRDGKTTDPEVLATIREGLVRTPGALKNAGLLEIMQEFRNKQKLTERFESDRQAREEAAAQGLVPSGVTVGPGGVSRSFEPLPQGLTEPERAAAAAKQGLEASGVDTQGRTLYSRPRSGEEFSITTAEGTQIVRRSGSAVAGGAGIAGEPTVASKSRVQEDLAQAQKMIIDLDAFQEGLKEGHLGIRGVLGDAVFDRMLPMFGVATADAARIESREELRLLIQGALRQVSVDERFSNEDMKAVKLAMPSTGMVESTERANIIVDVLRRIMAKRALIDAESVGAPPPAFALGALANEALLDAVKQGIVTVEEAKAEIDRRRKAE